MSTTRLEFVLVYLAKYEKFLFRSTYWMILSGENVLENN